LKICIFGRTLSKRGIGIGKIRIFAPQNEVITNTKLKIKIRD